MKAAINSQFSIEKFDGNGSFTLWQRRVKDIFVQQGLSKALKGKDGKPESMKANEWEELESRCVSTVRLCIADNIINNVMDEESASTLWEKLEKLYLAKSLTNKLHLKRQLYRLKMEDGGNLMEHMNLFIGFLDQLRKVDVKIDEEDKALLLLTSLPDSYDTLVTTLLYGKDTVSLEQVQATLVSHCTQKKSNIESGETSALAVQGDNRGRSLDGRFQGSRSKSKVKGKGVQCYGCKEFGHVKRDCPLRKKRNEDGAGTVAVVDDFGDALMVSEGTNTFSEKEWILDSGCSMHVCSKKKYFDNFEERSVGSLSLGDGSPCKIMGVGTVKIKMLDGAVRILGGVAYVPKMRRNLISLSRLDSLGCEVFAAGGAMKVTRGGLVLMNEKMCGGLYHLVGRTITPKNSVNCWKRGARENAYIRRVSSAGGAKTHVTGFQVADDSDAVIPAGREGEPRPYSGIN